MGLVSKTIRLFLSSHALRIYFLLLAAHFCFALPPSMVAQQSPGWQWQNPLPQGNTINSIKFAPDKKYGWAVGSDGAILRSRNGGFEWEAQTSETSTTLYGLYVRDKSRAVISGARGVILTTVNGGSKWISRPTGTKDHLFCVTFTPHNPLQG